MTRAWRRLRSSREPAAAMLPPHPDTAARRPGGSLMKVFTLEREGAAPITYTDKKRWLWLASLAMPLLPLGAMAATRATGSEWFLLAPLVFLYIVVPVLDALVGEDTSNPPEELVGQLSADRYYRVLTWATVPLYFVPFPAAAGSVGRRPPRGFGILPWPPAAGSNGTTAITVGQELGKKKGRPEAGLGRFGLGGRRTGNFWSSTTAATIATSRRPRI